MLSDSFGLTITKRPNRISGGIKPKKKLVLTAQDLLMSRTKMSGLSRSVLHSTAVQK